MRISDEIIKQIWEEEIINRNPLAVPNQSDRKAFVLGGQPGAGKSNLTKNIKKETKHNILEINGDNFRKYHPKYKKFQQENSLQMPKKTAEFTGVVTQAVLEKAIKEKYNIVIEGTFRTSETPIKTLKLFKDNGYQTNVLIQTCDKNISWNSCIERYEEMKKINPQEARYTDKTHHDNVIANLSTNAKMVFKSGLADNMQVVARIPEKNNPLEFKQKVIFDSKIHKVLNKVTMDKYINANKPEINNNKGLGY